MAEPARVANEPIRLKVPPHSVEAEQSLLGGLMLDNEAWLRVVDRVDAADFYRPGHRVIFEVMAELADRNEALDVVTVSEALSARALLEKAGGNGYLAELQEGSAGAANVRAYAGIVQEQAILRRLIGVANEISETAFLPEGRSSADVLDYAEQRIFEISEGRLKESAPQHIGRLADTVADTLDRLAKYGDSITGVPSGFDDLDAITAGFQKSDLVIVAARPSMGKTALMVNMAEHAVMANERDADRNAGEIEPEAMQEGGAVLIFSMEQPADQLVMRMLSSLGKIDQTRMRTGKLLEDDWHRFAGARTMLKDRPLYIDDTPALTPNDLRARARRVAREAGGLKMLMVDYLQLMRPSGKHDNRTGEISEISRSLKAIAKEFRCPLVACSQLNRSLESRTDKRPHMSDLRESGAIEQDADVILFIYRDEVYNPDSADKGLAEVNIGKQRNGPIGTVKLTFTPNLTKFANHIADDAYGYGPDVGGAYDGPPSDGPP